MNEISQRDMTLAEWRERRGISKTKHHELKNAGLGPRELEYPGRTIRITAADDAEWERQMRERGKRHAAQLERARRVELARQAAAAAVASPKHVSRIKRPGRRKG